MEPEVEVFTGERCERGGEPRSDQPARADPHDRADHAGGQAVDGALDHGEADQTPALQAERPKHAHVRPPLLGEHPYQVHHEGRARRDDQRAHRDQQHPDEHGGVRGVLHLGGLRLADGERDR